MTVNLVGNRMIKPLTSLPIDFKDQSEEFDDSKKVTQKLENKLKNSAINHYYLDKGKTNSFHQLLLTLSLSLSSDCTYLICGYEKGSVVIVSPKYHASKDINKH